MGKIVAFLDSSPDQEEILSFTKRIAKALDLPVLLLHAEETEPYFVGLEAGPPSVRDATATELRSMHDLLRRWTDHLCQEGVQASHLLLSGPLPEILLEQARKEGAEAIILGRSRRGKMSRLVSGSTAPEVIRGSPCPVIICPTETPTSPP